MTKSTIKFALWLAVLGAMLGLPHSDPARAKPIKVWVANYGVDSPTCGAIGSPCLGLQQAHDNVTAGGDISVLTPIDFGLMLNIFKSVNITNDGAGEASILSNFACGIAINANTGDVVSLRGLVIDGRAAAIGGICVDVASAVHIQNCVVRNVEGPDGVGIAWLSTENIQLFVSDTIIYNNGSTAASGGIYVRTSVQASANVVLDRVHLENNVRGLWVDGSSSSGNGAHVVLRDSVVSGNAGDGIRATSAPGRAPAFIIVEHTSIVNNAGTGILADGPRAVVVINDDTIARNGAGINVVNSGQIISFGNNKNFNNLGPEGAPTGFFSQM